VIEDDRGIACRAGKQQYYDMNYDTEKVDEAVLALLWLTAFREKKDRPWNTWKGHDWEAMNRLHEKGFISDPRNKNKSVGLSDEGARRAEELCGKLFGWSG
jgi:hypothetical protein